MNTHPVAFTRTPNRHERRSAAAIDRQEERVWLSPRDAADYVDCSINYLAQLRLSGGGPAFAKRGKLVRYNRADLDVWLSSLRVTSTSEAAAA